MERIQSLINIWFWSSSSRQVGFNLYLKKMSSINVYNKVPQPIILDNYERVAKNSETDQNYPYGPNTLKMLKSCTRLFDDLQKVENKNLELTIPFPSVFLSPEMENKINTQKRYGKDFYSAFGFSKEFKSAVSYIKKQNLLSVDENKTSDEKPSDEELYPLSEDIKKKYESLHAPLFNFEMNQEVKESTGVIKKDEGEKSKLETRYDDDDEFLCDTMSGYWRLLSGFDEFKISPPNFDAYAEGKKHWLETKPIPPQILDESINKCLNWMNKYFKD